MIQTDAPLAPQHDGVGLIGASLALRSVHDCSRTSVSRSMSRLTVGFADKLPEVVPYLAKHDITRRLSVLPFRHGESV